MPRLTQEQYLEIERAAIVDPSLDCTIPMSEIYYMVTFEENEPLR